MENYDAIVMKIETDLLTCEEQRQKYLKAIVYTQSLLNKKVDSDSKTEQLLMLTELIEILTGLEPVIKTFDTFLGTDTLSEDSLKNLQNVLDTTLIRSIASLEVSVRKYLEIFNINLDDFDD